MGQELLSIKGYTRTPRTYYLAVASNGAQVLRGSADDKYTHAVVNLKMLYPNAITYGTFHARDELAKRQCTSNKNAKKRYSNNSWGNWEVVTLQYVTAKQAREIKKADMKRYAEWRLKENELKELQAETQSVSEGKEMEN